MVRNKSRVRPNRVTGLPNKRDTPVKPAQNRDKCRRLLSLKHYEAVPEEPEEPEAEEMRVSTVRAASQSVFRQVKECQSCVATKISPATHVTPQAEAFKGGQIPVQKEKHNVAATPESITSSSTESDRSISPDDDEDCYSSDSAASRSLSSPEIFRKESYVETLIFPVEELLDLHPPPKNSTLLDVSHAESIHLHHPPNLSTIIDASNIPAEPNCGIKEPEAKVKTGVDSATSDKDLKRTTPPRLTQRRTILCKKKVWFKSPITAEAFRTKRIPDTKSTTHDRTESVQTSSPAEQIKPHVDSSGAGEISSEEDALPLTVTLKRPLRSSPDKAKFFDFASDRERDSFFQRMRERCFQLRSAPLFPLTAAKCTQPSVF